MSTLLNLKQPIRQRVVKTSDDEGFVVRGLNPVQVFGLYKRHSGDLDALYERVTARSDAGQKVTTADIEPLIMAVGAEFPTLLAELIVLASGGDPDSTDTAWVAGPTGDPIELLAFDAAVYIAENLPLPTQIEALVAIGDLTFTSEMPVGKFAALVVKMASSVTGALRSMTAAVSAPGFSESVATSAS